MADTVTDIGEIVKKCKILLLDIEGTITSITFFKDKLFPYAEEHVKEFLLEKWDNSDVKEAVAALRELAAQDKEASVDGVVPIPAEDKSKDEQIEALVNSVKWQMSLDRKTGALKQIQGLIWKQGYDSGDIKGHVYDEVPAALEKWRAADGRKVYVYSSGSVQAQKLLLGQSVAGDLRASVDGHFDTAVGAKHDAASYVAIAESIGCKPDEILFLTDIEKEAEAAKAGGVHAALVSREGNAPLAESAAAYPLLHSLAQLVATNKRKQDADIQEENPPKVAKTVNEEDVKTGSTEEQTIDKTTENMEVADPEVEKPTETKDRENDPTPMQVEMVVEEITEPDEKMDIPVVEVEPVVVEEKADADVTESGPASDTAKAADSTSGPDKAEPALTVLTEIEEITVDKPITDGVADIIEDLEPVVEEPVEAEAADAADPDLSLTNVGQELEKECDEILSKVSCVTNLDNITIKPMLKTITEENADAEAETADADIVDRILDTEIDFDIKNVDGTPDAPAPANAGDKAPAEPVAVDTRESAVEPAAGAGDDEGRAAQPEPPVEAAAPSTDAAPDEKCATNGDVARAALNGDDPISRLAVENGTEKADVAVNGAGGPKAEVNGAGDGPPDAEAADQGPPAADVKVKAVPAAPAEEARAEPAGETADA